MEREISFTKVLKDPANWHEDMDLDIMTENYLKLKPVMNKMFFYRYPEHPELFSLIFSRPNFADKVIKVLVDNDMHDLEKIYFTEYSEEDRNELINKGFHSLVLCEFGVAAIVYMHQGNVLFINLVL